MSNDTNDQDTTTIIAPPYVCESFMATTADEARMLEWLNTHAAAGYRLTDRQVLESGGASKRFHCVMERPIADAAKGGA